MSEEEDTFEVTRKEVSVLIALSQDDNKNGIVWGSDPQPIECKANTLSIRSPRPLVHISYIDMPTVCGSKPDLKILDIGLKRFITGC